MDENEEVINEQEPEDAPVSNDESEPEIWVGTFYASFDTIIDVIFRFATEITRYVQGCDVVNIYEYPKFYMREYVIKDDKNRPNGYTGLIMGMVESLNQNGSSTSPTQLRFIFTWDREWFWHWIIRELQRQFIYTPDSDPQFRIPDTGNDVYDELYKPYMGTTLIQTLPPRRGMSLWRRRRAHHFRNIKDAHPGLTCKQVAFKATEDAFEIIREEVEKEHPTWDKEKIDIEVARTFLEDWSHGKTEFTEDDVNNDYDAMNWKWKDPQSSNK